MFDNNLHIPLRIYDAVEKQDRFKSYATTKRFTQYTDTTHLPQFQVKIAKNDYFVTTKLVDVLTGSETNIPGYSDFYEVDFATFTYAIYDRSETLSTLPTGDYYLKITTASDVLYSEVFTVGDITGKTILEWYNTNDIGGIDYSNSVGGHDQYKNSLIFDCTLAKPEYIVEEEAVEDGDGNQMMTFQRTVKLFKFWFYAPEYIADALSIVSLHDFVTLTTHYGEADSESGSIYDFAMTAEWIESKGLAKITCEFRDSPVIKTPCGDEII
jgi:hypothetical protein